MTHRFNTICIIYSDTLFGIFKYCISNCEAETVETLEYDAKHNVLIKASKILETFGTFQLE